MISISTIVCWAVVSVGNDIEGPGICVDNDGRPLVWHGDTPRAKACAEAHMEDWISRGWTPEFYLVAKVALCEILEPRTDCSFRAEVVEVG